MGESNNTQLRECLFIIDAYTSTMTVRRYLQDLLFGFYHRAPFSFEEAIYDRDWDVLILLDACRVDSLQAVAPEYPWLPESVPSIWSVGGMSSEWMENTFTDAYAEEIANTAYVTANPYSHEFINKQQFALVDEVWRDEWDHDSGTVLAETMTERAIATARTHDPRRLIVHYMQPHFPSIPDPLESPIPLDDFGDEELNIWDDVRFGRVDIDRVRQSYLENLRYVLAAVDDLRQNIDAERAVISADHGECFGEWGFYGHMRNKPIPAVRRVPWVEIETTDSGDINPTTGAVGSRTSEDDVEQRLRSLGYKQ